MDNYDDLNELIDEDDLIDGGTGAELFHQATTYVQSAAGTLDNTVLLKLYSYYKQATEGPCSTENRPSWYDFRAKSKFEAWFSLGSMSKCDARAAYIDTVQSLGHKLRTVRDKGKGVDSAAVIGVGKEHGKTADSDADADAGVKNAVGWVTHSTLQQHGCNDDDNGDQVYDPNTKTFMDLISSDNLSAVKQLLSNHPHLAHTICSNDHLTPIHYAADRGSALVLDHLLSVTQNTVHATDCDGQTPLHYASTCGHTHCCAVLLKYGADAQLADRDGQTCLDVAADATIKDLLLNGC